MWLLHSLVSVVKHDSMLCASDIPLGIILNKTLRQLGVANGCEVKVANMPHCSVPGFDVVRYQLKSARKFHVNRGNMELNLHNNVLRNDCLQEIASLKKLRVLIASCNSIVEFGGKLSEITATVVRDGAEVCYILGTSEVRRRQMRVENDEKIWCSGVPFGLGIDT
ncbi:hypothetical protein OROHE_010284 [Orobanche hederae]